MSDHTDLSVCDVETTGRNEFNHRVIEVAVTRIEGGRWHDINIETFRFVLTDDAYRLGEPRAYEVNGYYPGHPDWEGAPVIDTPEARESWSRIAKILDGTILVNQNALFDDKFILEELVRHEARIPGTDTAYSRESKREDGPCRGRLWDVQGLSKFLNQSAGLRGWKLSTTFDLCGGPTLPTHRAESDVLRALWVMAAGMDKVREEVSKPQTKKTRAAVLAWKDMLGIVNTEAVRQAVYNWTTKRLNTTDARPVLPGMDQGRIVRHDEGDL